MVFNFPLPTPSPLPLHSLFSSPTHPSLPQSASTARQALRQTLKRHTKLNAAQQAQHLQPVLAAIETYLPLLFALSRGVNGADRRIEVVRRGDIDVEVQVGWTPTISAHSSLSLQRLNPNRHADSARVKGSGLEFELAFVMTALGYVLSNLARARCLRTLYGVKTPTTEDKTGAISAGMKNLLRAASAHTYLAASSTTTAVPDVDSSTQSSLSHLAMAEATLFAVLKDDAYLAACVQARNPHDTDWMVKAPDIPKVRALLFARLCVRAAEYAEQAAAAATAVSGVDEELWVYLGVVGGVGGAWGWGFLGVDGFLDGRVGEGIAWLRAGRGSLGVRSELAGDVVDSDKGKGRLGLSRLKRGWSEKREERKVEKDAGSSKGAGESEAELDWGDDAGREEEARVLDMLEEKWMKMNDTVSCSCWVCSG